MDFSKVVHYSLRYENSSVSGGVRLSSDSKIEHPLLTGRAIFEPGEFCIDYLMNSPEGNQPIKAFNIQKGFSEYNSFADLKSPNEDKRAKAEIAKKKLDDAMTEIKNNYDEVLNQMAEGAEFSEEFLSPKQKQLFLPKKNGEGYIVITPLCAIEISRRMRQRIIETNNEVKEAKQKYVSNLSEQEHLSSSKSFVDRRVSVNIRPMGGKNDQNVGMFAFTAKEALTACAPERDLTVAEAYSALYCGFQFEPSKELLVRYSAFRRKLSVRSANGKVVRTNIHDRKVELRFIEQACRQIHNQFLEFQARIEALPLLLKREALSGSNRLVGLALMKPMQRESRRLLSQELASLIHSQFLNYYEVKEGKKCYALDLSPEAMLALTNHAEEILLQRIQCKQY